MEETLEQLLETTEVDEMYLNKAVVFSDRHTGLECDVCDKILKKYISDNSKHIKYVIDMGDGIDNPFMSTFPVSPNYTTTAQEEFDLYATFWKDVHKMIPRAQKILIPGNHDKTRLDNSKTLSRGIASLRSVQYENVLKEALDAQGLPLNMFTFANTSHVIKFTKKYKALFTHGDPRMNAYIKGGVTGPRRTAEMYPFDGDIFMGHIHSHMVIPRIYDGRNLYTADMIADKKQMAKAYLNHHPYTTGFMVIKYNDKRNIHSVRRYEIKDGMAEIDGKVYKGGK